MHTNSTTHTVRPTASRIIIEQGRRWFRFAHALDTTLRAGGSRLWVKPKLHAQYGLRQTQALQARTFVLTTRLDGGQDSALLAVLGEGFHPSEELAVRVTERGRVSLSTQAGHELGSLNRPGRSWVCPLIEAGHPPTFYLREVAVHDGALKAHVIIAHFHAGVEAYLEAHALQHDRQHITVAV